MLSTAEDRPPAAAFAVSRAVGNSVVRHRVTRQLRAAVLPHLSGDLPPGTSVVVRALPPAAAASFAELERALAEGLVRAGRGQSRAPSSGQDVPAPNNATTPPADADPAAGTQNWGTRKWTPLRVLGTPVRWLLLGLIQLYRWTISPILPPTCRFHPSCSAYAMGAIEVHGAGKGTLLAAWRLLRCNPWNLGGLDPVPPRGEWKPDVHPDGTPRTCRTLHA